MECIDFGKKEVLENNYIKPLVRGCTTNPAARTSAATQRTGQKLKLELRTAA